MADLKKYNKKRNFNKSNEPQGKKSEKSKKLSYVIQHHLARADHYDFRLENDGVLLSWAIPKGPSLNTSDRRLAIKVEDHPVEYKEFEGNIPKGEYGGGVVQIWDKGFWYPLEKDVSSQLKKGVLKFKLSGERLNGDWNFVKLKNEKNDKENWLLIKEKDNYVDKNFDIKNITTSVKTGRTVEEIEKDKPAKDIKKNPFDKIDIQLAKLADDIPNGDKWLWEMKFDGYRIVAFLENNNVRLMSRNWHDYSDKFKEVAESLKHFLKNRAVVLDGEMVVVDENGKTDFSALQTYIKSPKNKNLAYMVFDILALDGEDLRDKPCFLRKEILEELLKNSPNDITYSKHIEGNGKEFFKLVCDKELEGMVGKEKNSKYSGTRNGDWIKCKCYKRQEFVVGGYTKSSKILNGISSLLLGYYDDKKLIYAGKTGTGFSTKERVEFEKQFKKLSTDKSPFDKYLKSNANENIYFIKPKLVAEVSFCEWTSVNQLRQASFKGFRIDKNATEVVKE